MTSAKAEDGTFSPVDSKLELKSWKLTEERFGAGSTTECSFEGERGSGCVDVGLTIDEHNGDTTVGNAKKLAKHGTRHDGGYIDKGPFDLVVIEKICDFLVEGGSGIAIDHDSVVGLWSGHLESNYGWSDGDGWDDRQEG